MHQVKSESSVTWHCSGCNLIYLGNNLLNGGQGNWTRARHVTRRALISMPAAQTLSVCFDIWNKLEFFSPVLSPTLTSPYPVDTLALTDFKRRGSPTVRKKTLMTATTGCLTSERLLKKHFNWLPFSARPTPSFSSSWFPAAFYNGAEIIL